MRKVLGLAAPVAYELSTGGITLGVRAIGSLAEVERNAQALWPKYFPDAIMKTRPAKDILAANYEENARMAKLLAIATGIALAIAAFGRPCCWRWPRHWRLPWSPLRARPGVRCA